MCSQQVVPSVSENQVGGLAVNGNVFLYIAFHPCARLGVELNEAYGSEVGAVAHPQPTRGGIEQHAGVYGILVFHAVGGTHLDGFGEFEVGRLWVERLVPHRQNPSVVATAQSSAGGSIYNKVLVANFQHVGGCSAARAFGSVVPAPAVFRNQSAATRAKGVVFSVAFGDGRRVVNIGRSHLCLYRRHTKKERRKGQQECISFHNAFISQI